MFLELSLKTTALTTTVSFLNTEEDSVTFRGATVVFSSYFLDKQLQDFPIFPKIVTLWLFNLYSSTTKVLHHTQKDT